MVFIYNNCYNNIIVDVRSPEEYAEGHIPGAINLDWAKFRGAKSVFIGVEKQKQGYRRVLPIWSEIYLLVSCFAADGLSSAEL